MAKEKKPYAKPVLDKTGTPILVGSKVVYAVRHGNIAELRVGMVEFIEAAPAPYYMPTSREVPIVYCMFEGNKKSARCAVIENFKVIE